VSNHTSKNGLNLGKRKGSNLILFTLKRISNENQTILALQKVAQISEKPGNNKYV
jgi:hypothetical protein